jgi:lysophospholipase L1-like esterase
MRKKIAKVVLLFFCLIVVGGELLFRHTIPMEGFIVAKTVGLVGFMEGTNTDQNVVEEELGFCNPSIWHTGKKVRYEFNREGYRGPLRPKFPPPGVTRIMCLGDSITMGQDVELPQTFCALLPEFLHEQRPAKRFESIDLGRWGASSQQGLQLLKLRGLDYHPKILVIAFGTNDATDLRYSEFDVPDAQVFGPFQLRWYHHLGWVRGAHQIWGVTNYYYRRWKMKRTPPVIPETQVAEQGFERAFAGGATRVPVDQFRANLAEFCRLCRERRITPVFLNLADTPAYAQATKAAADDCGAVFFDGRKAVFDAIPDVAAGRVLPEWRASYQQLLGPEVFRRPGNEYLWVSTDNSHLNVIGHYLLGRRLAPLIADSSR